MLRKKPKERIEDVSIPVDREDVLGLVGVYVDDTLVTGPKNICAKEWSRHPRNCGRLATQNT